MVGKNLVDGSYVILYWLELNDASAIPGNYKDWFLRFGAKKIQMPELDTSAYIAPHLIGPDTDENERSAIRDRHSSQWKRGKIEFENELVTLSPQSLSQLYQES